MAKPKTPKKPSKPKAKVNTQKADNPKAAPGDNSTPALTEDQQRALFFNHKKAYQRALEVKKKADVDLKNVCKLVKAEGGSVDDIKVAITLEEEKGEAKVRAQIEDKIRVARWVGASVGYQIDMFEDRRPSIDKAYDDGKIAGLKGDKNHCPFDASVPQFKRWNDGWQDGQAARMRKLAPKAPEQPSAKPPTPPDAAEAQKTH